MRDYHFGLAGLGLEDGGDTAAVGPTEVDALAVTHAAQLEGSFRKPALADPRVAPGGPNFHQGSGNGLGAIDGVATALLMRLAQTALDRVTGGDGPAPPQGQPVLT